MMIGWRRRAKAERARLENPMLDNPMSAEHLYELVNQTLLANFGPLGSYAITRRAASDSDDIFHTMLASSVAHDITATLINHNAVPLKPQAPVAGSFVAATSAFASTHALPAEPLAAPSFDLPPLRTGSHAAAAPALVPAAVAALAAAPAAAAPAAAAPAAAAFTPAPVASLSATPAAATTAALPILPLPVSAIAAPSAAAAPAEPVSARPAPLAPLAPIVAVPVSADLAAALVELDTTGPIDVTPPASPAPAPVSAPVSAARASADLHLVDADR